MKEVFSALKKSLIFIFKDDIEYSYFNIFSKITVKIFMFLFRIILSILFLIVILVSMIFLNRKTILFMLGEED